MYCPGPLSCMVLATRATGSVWLGSRIWKPKSSNPYPSPSAHPTNLPTTTGLLPTGFCVTAMGHRPRHHENAGLREALLKQVPLSTSMPSCPVSIWPPGLCMSSGKIRPAFPSLWRWMTSAAWSPGRRREAGKRPPALSPPASGAPASKVLPGAGAGRLPEPVCLLPAGPSRWMPPTLSQTGPLG